MVFLAEIGAIIAGLYMCTTQGFTILRARRTGVIISKSHGAARIERAIDPERFERVIAVRVRGLGPGLLFVAGGIGALFWMTIGLIQQQG